MIVQEIPGIIQLASGPTAGVFHIPRASRGLGVVVLISLRQTRVGPHRQNVLLARQWSASGFPVLRFDYAGKGDSSGNDRSAWSDISHGIAALMEAAPEVKKVVLWGVCGAGRQAVLYAVGDARVGGVMVANPPLSIGKKGGQWLHDTVKRNLLLLKPQIATQIRVIASSWIASGLWSLASAPTGPNARLRDRILSRVSRASGWTLLRLFGNRDTMRVAGEFLLRTHRREQFINALCGLDKPSLLVLSDDDDGAMAFTEIVLQANAWEEPVTQGRMVCHSVKDGGHTFENSVAREQVERITLQWLLMLDQEGSEGNCV